METLINGSFFIVVVGYLVSLSVEVGKVKTRVLNEEVRSKLEDKNISDDIAAIKEVLKKRFNILVCLLILVQGGCTIAVNSTSSYDSDKDTEINKTRFRDGQYMERDTTITEAPNYPVNDGNNYD